MLSLSGSRGIVQKVRKKRGEHRMVESDGRIREAVLSG